jgi:hypothetical protein
LQLQCLWLPSVQDGIDDVGSKKGQPQDAAEVGLVDGFSPGEFGG